MRSLSDVLSPFQLANPEAAEARLVSAYHAFMDGAASKEDAELILVDLARESGYFDVLPDDATSEQALQHNGRRRVFSRIMYVLDLPMSRVHELNEALLSTPIYDN